MWDVTTGECQHVLAAHDAPVAALAFARDGRFAISGGEDRTLRVWDLVTEREVVRWGAEHPVTACAVLPDEPLTIAVGEESSRTYTLCLTT